MEQIQGSEIAKAKMVTLKTATQVRATAKWQ